MIRVVGELALSAGEKWADKVCAFQANATITYAEVLDGSLKLARFLLQTGLRKGDRVCFYLEKRFEKICSIFGIALAGGVFVPIRRLARIPQATHIINDCGARILITTSSRVLDILEQLSAMPHLHTIVIIDKIDRLELPPDRAIIGWDEIMDQTEGALPEMRITEHDLAAILYTSGSTGRPKGVVLSHLNIMAGASKISEYLKITPDERILSILTFGFDYGLNQLMTTWSHGAQIVLLDYLFPRDIIKAVDKFEITGLAAVATTWIQLLQMSWENSGMARLRYITNSGGAIPEHYVREMRLRLPDTQIFLMYGLTEAFRSTYLDPALVDRYPTSIGQAVPGEEILVLDAHDQPVKPGEVGELVHRGVLVAQGYWNDPELTRVRYRPNPLQPAEVPLREMVVYSGDQVRIDENGLLYFIGRHDEMIKCSGNRISPSEVEEVLYQCEGIADVVAFGIPHETYGQSVYAVVSLAEGSKLMLPAMLKYCKDHLPSYMVPAEIEIWDSLPRNDNGKLDRSGIKRMVYTNKKLPEKH
jgi:acyl-CoA ligase (AMP-forming) (exosortase A-associated)